MVISMTLLTNTSTRQSPTVTATYPGHTNQAKDDLPPLEYSSVVLLASLVVFGLPAIIISIICLLRLRIHLLEKKERRTGVQRRINEVSSLMTSLQMSRENTLDIAEQEKPMLNISEQQASVHMTTLPHTKGGHDDSAET